MSVIYFEHYPHYMGTMNATIKFTDKEFDNLIKVAKQSIKAKKKGDEEGSEAIYLLVEKIEKKKKVSVYALAEAVINYFDSPKRPQAITTALKKKGVWSSGWEEGSHAFSTKGAKVAKKAVAKIEAQLSMNEF